jgi:hypothetical protein
METTVKYEAWLKTQKDSPDETKTEEKWSAWCCLRQLRTTVRKVVAKRWVLRSWTPCSNLLHWRLWRVWITCPMYWGQGFWISGSSLDRTRRFNTEMNWPEALVIIVGMLCFTSILKTVVRKI